MGEAMCNISAPLWGSAPQCTYLARLQAACAAQLSLRAVVRWRGILVLEVKDWKLPTIRAMNRFSVDLIGDRGTALT